MKFVYEWRLQQEAALRASKGVGMTDEQVINFVNGCKCHQDRRSQAIAELSPRAGHNPSIPMSNLISISVSGISDLADLDLNRLSCLRTLHANAA
jgi:hypothetical protein